MRIQVIMTELSTMADFNFKGLLSVSFNAKVIGFTLLIMFHNI